MLRPIPSTVTLLLLALAACDSQPQPKANPTTAPTPPAAAAASATKEGTAVKEDTAMDFYSLKLRSLEGEAVDLAQYRGKVTLVVNVASECGYTPQYKGLQALHAELKAKGFAVLGFPSNDFGGQEPGSPQEIRTFCTSKYAVDFPLFEKVGTKNGTNQSPVYALLGKASGKLPNWNFCKYLVGKDGKVVQFFDSKAAPENKDLRAAIERALQS